MQRKKVKIKRGLIGKTKRKRTIRKTPTGKREREEGLL
jgi:hypothetical protein